MSFVYPFLDEPIQEEEQDHYDSHFKKIRPSPAEHTVLIIFTNIVSPLRTVRLDVDQCEVAVM